MLDRREPHDNPELMTSAGIGLIAQSTFQPRCLP